MMQCTFCPLENVSVISSGISPYVNYDVNRAVCLVQPALSRAHGLELGNEEHVHVGYHCTVVPPERQ